MNKTSEIHQHLIEKSKELDVNFTYLIEENGELKLEPYTGNIFPFLVKTIISQQLSNTAANTIHARVENFRQEQNLSLIELFSEEYKHKLNDLGISRNKIKAINSVKKGCEKGNLNKAHLTRLSTKKVYQYLTDFWGVGKWTAQMVSIFFLGNLNVFPDHDTSFVKGINLLTDEQKHNRVKSTFTPYNSILALHIWNGIDNKII